jgi:hypothetical protein
MNLKQLHVARRTPAMAFNSEPIPQPNFGDPILGWA